MTNNSRRPLLLTVTEVAKLLKLERSKVYLLMEEGLIEAFRLGGHWRIRASSIDRLLPSVPSAVSETITDLSNIASVVQELETITEAKLEATLEVTDGNDESVNQVSLYSRTSKPVRRDYVKRD